MFGSRSPVTSQLIFTIDDAQLRYLYLDLDEQGIFVRSHACIQLPSQVIVRGEILKAQVFLDILLSIKKELQIDSQSVPTTLLLPQDYVVVEQLLIPKINLKDGLTNLVQGFLEEHKESYPWVSNHSYVPVYDKRSNKVYVEAIRADRYRSFESILKQAGFSLVTIHGELCFAGSLVSLEERSIVVVVGQEVTYLAEFEYGHLLSSKRFEFSYQSLVRVVRKYLKSSSREQIENIIAEYGISRAHREEQVYRELMRSLTPLADMLRKRCTTTHIPVSIVYLGTPLSGLVDALEMKLPGIVTESHPFTDLATNFHEVLSLSKSESHAYALLALAGISQGAYVRK